MVWCRVEVGKISPLDTPNQILTRSKFLGDHVLVNLEYFCQTNKYNETGYLLQKALNKLREKNKNKTQSFQFPTQTPHKLVKFSISSLKKPEKQKTKTLSFIVAELRLLKHKSRASNYKWLKFSANYKLLTLQWGTWLGRNQSCKWEWDHIGRFWWSWGH